MGAPDRGFTGFIPKELIDKADAWSLQPLGSKQQKAPRQKTAEPTRAEIEQAAFQRGCEHGHAEAAQVAAQVRGRHAAQIGQVLDQLRGRFSELETSAADAVLALSFAIARQVLRCEPSIRPDGVLPVAREALAMVVDQHAAPRLVIHPDEFELVQADLEADGRLKGAVLVADAAVGRGGCRVETPHGDIDATVASRWHRVLADLGYPTEPQAKAVDAAGETPSADA